MSSHWIMTSHREECTKQYCINPFAHTCKWNVRQLILTCWTVFMSNKIDSLKIRDYLAYSFIPGYHVNLICQENRSRTTWEPGQMPRQKMTSRYCEDPRQYTPANGGGLTTRGRRTTILLQNVPKNVDFR